MQGLSDRRRKFPRQLVRAASCRTLQEGIGNMPRGAYKIGTGMFADVHGEMKMLREDQLAHAISVACACHFGQRDMGGAAYILHPLRVMAEMEDERQMIVAVLHDTVEDAINWSVEMVRDQFGDRIAAAVDALTKRAGESYDDYLARVKADELATKVKLADLKDNCDLNRLGRAPTDADRKRLDKYLRARAILQG